LFILLVGGSKTYLSASWHFVLEALVLEALVLKALVLKALVLNSTFLSV